MKTKHIVELVGVLGFFGLLIWYFSNKATSGAAPGDVSSTSSSLNNKPSTAGGDSTLQAPDTNLAPSTASVPGVNKPDVNGNQWVNGVDTNGNKLGAVEVDSAGNFLVKAATGPQIESLKGRAHF